MTLVLLNGLPANIQLLIRMSALLIFLFLFPACFSDFHIGRLREGQYEYPRLNGWMTPTRARHRCDRDPQCGGFTYKGFISLDSSQEFNTFFFNLLLNFESGAESWHWVTYKAEKDYIQFNNMTDPQSATQALSKPLSSSSAKVKCLRMRSKCAGILENGEDGVIISLLIKSSSNSC